MPQRISSPELIGRGPELDALCDALDDATGGRFRAVFVAGEAGVGKSRLLRELERRSQAYARTVAGECTMLAAGEVAFAPVRSALRRLRAELGPPVFDELAGPGRDQLARLVPQLQDTEEPDPADPFARARLFDLLLGMLARLAASTPVVLVIEDIQWGDRSTLDLLAYLLANARRERLLLICTYRTDELNRGHPLRAFLAAHERPPVVRRIELQRFTPEELAAQIHGILGADADPDLVRRLHERTEGNAFFTEELLAASPDAVVLPASLRDALMLRLESLPEPAQQLLRAAAVHGGPVSERLLGAALGQAAQELRDALRDAVDANVLVRRGAESFRFRHALFGEALDADLLPGERIRLRVALAEAIEGDPSLVDANGRAGAQLTAHWLGAQRLPEALAAAVRAGEEARGIYAFAEAQRHFERGLELWSRVEDAERRAGMDEAALCELAADAAHLNDDGEVALRLIERAIALIDPRKEPRRAAVMRERRGHYLWLFAGDDGLAQANYEEALELLPAGEEPRERARLLAMLGQVMAVRGDMERALEVCAESIALARETGGRVEEAHALTALGMVFGLLGRREDAIAHLRDGIGICDEIGDLDALSRALTNLGEVVDQDARLEEAVVIALDAARRMAEVGWRDMSALMVAEGAGRLLKLGRLDEAEELADGAFDLPALLGKQCLCAVGARVAVQRGDLAAAEPLLEAAVEAMPQAPATWLEPLGSARVECELLRGDPERALELVEELLDGPGREEHAMFVARLHAHGARAAAVLAERARAAGDADAVAAAAARAHALLGPLARKLEPQRWLGTPPPEARLYLARCAAEAAWADGTWRAAQWEELAGRWSELGLRLEEAYALLRAAECHLLHGRRDAARPALAAGRRIASECGAHWLGRELDELARRGRLGAAQPDRALGLTDRELAVLELVAAGKTNREIGEQLFMATKTASVHVSRILTKLGVSSRVEAATAAQRLGLVE
jgi:DNA-binding CsgD family transcriptional regulator/tetratricopeptide (TPR) repeat protein